LGPTHCSGFDKSTVTDKNGYWSITGPNGCETAMWNNLLTLIFPFCCYTKEPSLASYKKGYCLDFVAFAYNKKPYGIILSKRMTSAEISAYYKIYGANKIPLIVLDDPEKRIETLDFPFTFSEEGNTIIAIESDSYKTTHKTFHVDGFKKTNKKCSEYKSESKQPKQSKN
jgi:hypothetical protein